MPILWKNKPTAAGISRLVAGLHTPPKRSGSLVVETGFPASIVGLLIKNCDRLRKPFKKTKHSHGGKHPHPNNCISAVAAAAEHHADPPASSAPWAQAHFSEQPVFASAWMVDHLHTKTPARSPELRGEGAHSVPVVSGKGLDRPCANLVSSVVSMVFVVVVLALYTKRLVVGITLLTAVLLLLERMGVAIPWLLKRRRSAGRGGGDARTSRYKRSAFVFEGMEDFHFKEEVVGDGGFDSDRSEADMAFPCREEDGLCNNPDNGWPRQDRRHMDDNIKELETSAGEGKGNRGARTTLKILKRVAPIQMRNQIGESKENLKLES